MDPTTAAAQAPPNATAAASVASRRNTAADRQPVSAGPISKTAAEAPCRSEATSTHATEAGPVRVAASSDLTRAGRVTRGRPTEADVSPATGSDRATAAARAGTTALAAEVGAPGPAASSDATEIRGRLLAPLLLTTLTQARTKGASQRSPPAPTGAAATRRALGAARGFLCTTTGIDFASGTTGNTDGGTSTRPTVYQAALCTKGGTSNTVQ